MCWLYALIAATLGACAGCAAMAAAAAGAIDDAYRRGWMDSISIGRRGRR